MKKTITFCFLTFVAVANAQVGINTTTPKSTLDVQLNPDQTLLEGIIAPRLTGDQLFARSYTVDQNGAIVYITAAASSANQTGQTINIKRIGYYYLDASTPSTIVWRPLTGDYSSDAWNNNTTSTPKRVELSTNSDDSSRAAGTEVVIQDTGNMGIGNISPNSRLHVNSGATSRSVMRLQNISNSKDKGADGVNYANRFAKLMIDENGHVFKAYEPQIENTNGSNFDGTYTVPYGSTNTSSNAIKIVDLSTNGSMCKFIVYTGLQYGSPGQGNNFYAEISFGITSGFVVGNYSGSISNNSVPGTIVRPISFDITNTLVTSGNSFQVSEITTDSFVLRINVKPETDLMDLVFFYNPSDRSIYARYDGQSQTDTKTVNIYDGLRFR